VQKRSLTAIGIPGKSLSNFGLLSKFFALFKALSEHLVMNEFNFLSLLIFFIKDCVISSDFISLFFLVN
jgi:hypothetical protein